MNAPPNPLRVAIVGSGPSGFYAVESLLKRDEAQVDMFDRLPTPFGLVRLGVAPDHPKIKSVTRRYEKTAASERFRFFGHVDFGTDITHADLASRYHAIVYAVGAQTDRSMGIPGEELPGSHAATEFVAWYNGHPDYRDRQFDLSGERAVVVGNGNVAMDVARMLALTGDELRTTDTADHAIEAMESSGIREIVVLGRRGPAQAAFTNPEILELGEMLDADVVVAAEDVELDALSEAFLASEEADNTARKNVEILTGYAAREPSGKPRRIVLRFCVSPVEIHGDGRVEGVTVVRNELVRDDSGQIRPHATEQTERIDCGLVFRSVGYRGVELAGVPFDERRGVIPNEGGRIVDASGAAVTGEYVVGWIKRGPSGVIGTNKKDADESVTLLLADADSGRLKQPSDPSPEGIEELLAERRPDHVSWSDWGAIDRAELAAGERQGRPRVKLTRIAEMLDAAAEAREASV